MAMKTPVLRPLKTRASTWTPRESDNYEINWKDKMRKGRGSTDESYLQLSILERERIGKDSIVGAGIRRLSILWLEETLGSRETCSLDEDKQATFIYIPFQKAVNFIVFLNFFCYILIFMYKKYLYIRFIYN